MVRPDPARVTRDIIVMTIAMNELPLLGAVLCVPQIHKVEET